MEAEKLNRRQPENGLSVAVRRTSHPHFDHWSINTLASCAVATEDLPVLYMFSARQSTATILITETEITSRNTAEFIE